MNEESPVVMLITLSLLYRTESLNAVVILASMLAETEIDIS